MSRFHSPTLLSDFLLPRAGSKQFELRLCLTEFRFLPRNPADEIGDHQLSNNTTIGDFVPLIVVDSLQEPGRRCPKFGMCLGPDLEIPASVIGPRNKPGGDGDPRRAYLMLGR